MLNQPYGKFNLFHCTTGHVQVIYLTYTYFRRLPFDIQIRQGQKTPLIETCYIARQCFLVCSRDITVDGPVLYLD